MLPLSNTGRYGRGIRGGLWDGGLEETLMVAISRLFGGIADVVRVILQLGELDMVSHGAWGG